MIFVGTHHKTGTVLFGSVFKAVANELGLDFYTGSQRRLPAKTQVWFNEHSWIDRSAFAAIVGIHVVRHPLEVVCSAYRYHLGDGGAWFASQESGERFNLNGQSYKQTLATLSARDGTLFEMMHFSFETIMDMYNWDYNDSRFLNVRLEDVRRDFDGTFSRIFAFVGLEPAECLPIAQRFDANRMDQHRINSMAHITNKGGDQTWQNYFSDREMIKTFNQSFPRNLLPKLGYSSAELHSHLDGLAATPGKTRWAMALRQRFPSLFG